MNKFNKHLNFYIKHKISPVVYSKISNNLLLQTRKSLYTQLSITPLMIKNSDVLEVAPGSGQNSQFLASCMPRTLTLVEPNPTALKDIKLLYSKANGNITQPRLVKKRLEDFSPRKKFDIVICENWLGSSKYEKNLIQKLGHFVNVDGVMSVTAVSPIGFLPNIIRRAISARLTYKLDTFECRKHELIKAFDPHLRTLAGMTRSTEDWVLDNMLNPAYFDICLTAPMIISALGKNFEFLGSSPRFFQDWRWFKKMDEKSKKINNHFLSDYYRNCHKHMDYKTLAGSSSVVANKKLEKITFDLVAIVGSYEKSLFAHDQINEKKYFSEIKKAINTVLHLTKDMYELDVYEELVEGCNLLLEKKLSSNLVANAKKFRLLFGRETLYLSFQRLT